VLTGADPRGNHRRIGDNFTAVLDDAIDQRKQELRVKIKRGRLSAPPQSTRSEQKISKARKQPLDEADAPGILTFIFEYSQQALKQMKA